MTVTGLVMTILMLIKGRGKVHRLWMFFCISVLFWGAGGYKIATTQDIAQADLWWRITHIGVIFIPVFFTHFVYEFLQIKRKWFVISIYVLGVIFLITNFVNGLFIANMRWVFNQFYYDSPPGPFYIPFTAFFFGLVIYSHYELWKSYSKTKGIRRSQIKFFFFGMAVSFAGGGLSFLPVYKIDFYPVFNLLAFLYPIIVGYTILRYRLMDIRIAIRRTAIRVTLAVFTYGIFHLVTWAMIRAFGSVWASGALFTGAFIAVAFVLVFPFVERFAMAFTNRYLFSAVYSTQQTITTLAQKLTTIIDFNEVLKLIAATVKKTMDIQRVAIIAQNHKADTYLPYKISGFKKKDIAQVIENKTLFQWLAQSKEILVASEINYMKEAASAHRGKMIFDELAKSLENLPPAVFLPLVVKDELVGMIVLGEKRFGDAYTKEDIQLLEALSYQAAIAVENARLYNHMEEVVERRTQELNERNVRLQKLLNMRSEFLDIASHQLRTPISVIKGSVSMLLEGDYDEGDPKVRKEVYQEIFLRTEKLTNIVRDILYASELDTNEFVLKGMDLEEVKLIPFLQKQVAEHQKQAREKAITMQLEFQEQDITVNGAERYLEVIFDNLLDNALLYTPNAGKVTIRVVSIKEMARVEVEDTGIGIPQEDQNEMFTKFKRASNATLMHANGSGLGLFIVKRMIEGHPKGAVGFKSTQGRGSTFWVELQRYDAAA